MKRKQIIAFVLALALLLPLAGCGGAKQPETPDETAAPVSGAEQASATPRPGEENAPKIDGLTYESTVENLYADQFAIYKYEGGYSFIDMVNSDQMLVVPEGGAVPKGLGKDVVVVRQPLNDIYLVSTACMALFDALNALDRIAFVGTKQWYIENAVTALGNCTFAYAGKYNAPDYEMLISGGCQLAIESTMVLHNPEVKEKLIEIGIPTVVERSSYEDHPLGRTEWIKIYGALLGLEAEAEAVFNAEVDKIRGLEGLDSTGKTVAFFYVSSTGNVVTYKSNGYIPAMISIAGGQYIFSDLGVDEDSKLSSINMSMEEFYHSAVNADYIIYNCSIVDQLDSIDKLLDLSPVLSDFKAVKEGNAWCTRESMFQQTDKMGTIIQEMNKIFTGQSNGHDLNYIFRLE